MSPYNYVSPYTYFTYHTSVFFLLTGLAYRNGGFAIEIPLYFLTWTSTLHHAKFYEMYPGKRLILYADRLLSNGIAAVSLKYALQCPWNHLTIPWLIMYYTCLLYTGLLYYLYLIHIHGALKAHATIHISSCLGLLCLRRIL